MRTPPLKIMLAIVVLAGLVAAPAAAAKTKTNVEVLAAGTSGAEPLYFQGLVNSSKLSCKKERKVTLYRAQSGKDKRLGAERTIPGESLQSGKWVWQIEVPTPRVGNYYGAVKKTGSCRGDKSKKFKLDDPIW
jgi:hypothetical protein